MKKHWIEEIFEEMGAIRKGHFSLTSGKHAKEYLDKIMIYPDGEIVSDICFEMAQEIGRAFPGELPNKKIEVVVGPAEGGIILAHEVAKRLSEFYQRKIPSVFTEKEGKKQVLKRPVFRKIVAGSLVLIVDDILTTGGSVLEVIREIQNAGGHIMGVIVICNRGGVKSCDIMDYPLFFLWKKDTESWDPSDCPPCKQNIPLEDPKSC